MQHQQTAQPVAPTPSAEDRARVYDAMANNPCVCDSMAEVYRQKAYDIRRAAAAEAAA